MWYKSATQNNLADAKMSVRNALVIKNAGVSNGIISARLLYLAEQICAHKLGAKFILKECCIRNIIWKIKPFYLVY